MFRLSSTAQDEESRFDHIHIDDEDNCMSYLNEWDEQIPNLDVVDDYKTERKQILKCQGESFPFSFGDVCFLLFREIH